MLSKMLTVKIKSKLLIATLLLLAALSVVANNLSAATLNVPGDLSTIQAAIDAASPNDTIFIEPGTYSGPGNHDIDLAGKKLTISSIEGPATTIISCQGTSSEPHRAFYFHSGEDSTTTIDGLTIRNGARANGSGIFCNNASPTIRNCIVQSCNLISFMYDPWGTPGGGGAGLHLMGSAARIYSCHFESNSGGETPYPGGGVFCQSSSPVFESCIFSNNGASNGGAIACVSSSPVFRNCTVVHNLAGRGTALACLTASSPQFEQCIIANNSYGGPFYCPAPGTVLSFSCCDVSNNQGGDWVDCAAGQGTVNGNFSADPMIVPTTNYLFENSPCLAQNNSCGSQIGALGVIASLPNPTLTGPTNGTIAKMANSIAFHWNTVFWGSSYSIEFSRQTEISDVPINGRPTGTFSQVEAVVPLGNIGSWTSTPGFLGRGVHYWHVASNSGSGVSRFSESGSFTVSQPPELTITPATFGPLTSNQQQQFSINLTSSGVPLPYQFVYIYDHSNNPTSPTLLATLFINASGQASYTYHAPNYDTNPEMPLTFVASFNSQGEWEAASDTTHGTIAAQYPSISMNPTHYDFGTLIINHVSDGSFSILNDGLGILQIAGVSSSNPAFLLLSPTTYPVTLSHLQSISATVRFAPTEISNYSGTLTILSNDPAHPSMTINLSGIAQGNAALQLCDEFNGSSINTAMWNVYSGTWTVSGGVVTGYWPEGDAYGEQGNLVSTTTAQPIGDCTFDVDMVVQSNQAGHRIVMYHSAGNKWNINYDWRGSVNTELKQNGGIYGPPHYHTDNLTIFNTTPGSINHARVVKSGNQITCYLNGQLVLSFAESVWNGDVRFGLGCYGTESYERACITAGSGQPPEMSGNLALLVQNANSLDAEEQAAYNFASTHGFNVTRVDPSMIIADQSILANYDGFWAANNSSPAGFNNPTIVNALKSQIEGGKGLVVTWYGVYLISYLGYGTAGMGSAWSPAVSDHAYWISHIDDHPAFVGLTDWIPPVGPPDDDSKLLGYVTPGYVPAGPTATFSAPVLTPRYAHIHASYGWPHQSYNPSLCSQFGVMCTGDRTVAVSNLVEKTVGSGRVLFGLYSMAGYDHWTYGAMGYQMMENILKYSGSGGTTQNKLPAPVLVKPDPGSTTTPNPKFVWLPVSGAVQYKLELSETQTFETLHAYLVMPGVATTQTLPLGSKLEVGGSYYWRMATYNGAAWGDYSETRSLEVRPAHTIAVFVPHPDDEVLGPGATIQDATMQNDNVYVFILTNGDGYKDNCMAKYGHECSDQELMEYAGRRQQESRNALTHLGVPEDHINFLGYPDGLLSQMFANYTAAQCDPIDPSETPTHTAETYNRSLFGNTANVQYCSYNLLTDIETAVSTVRPDVIYVTQSYDTHPDHEACFRFVTSALIELSRSWLEYDLTGMDVRSFLVHYQRQIANVEGNWYPFPEGEYTGYDMIEKSHQGTPSGEDVYSAVYGNVGFPTLTFPLSAEMKSAKKLAIESYQSQLLTARTYLMSFVRNSEEFWTRSALDIAIPPTSWMSIRVSCPVELDVVDPVGRGTDVFSNQIPGCLYVKASDGTHLDRLIRIPSPIHGYYSITVIPTTNADPNDVFSLNVQFGGADFTLASNVHVGTSTGYQYTINTLPNASLAGFVCKDATVGLLGVPLDIYDSLSNFWKTVITDDSGYYHVDGIPNGNYSITIHPPLGYAPDSLIKHVTVNHVPVTVNFTLTKVAEVAKATAIPTIWYHSWISSSPTGTVRAYIGNIPAGHTANNIVPSTIRLNGQVPIFGNTSRVRASMTGFTGFVLEIAFNRQLAVQSLSSPIHDSTYQVIMSGNFTDGSKFLAPVEIALAGGGAAKETVAEEEAIPETYTLGDAYPNPFNPNTTIEFGLPNPSHATLEIFNILGQKIKTLIDRDLPPGYHSIQWNSTDDNGNPVATGIYLYKLIAGEFTETKKMQLLK